MNVPYEILVPDDTRTRLAAYEGDLASGFAAPGRRLASGWVDAPAGPVRLEPSFHSPGTE
jgi:hypothetical protein